MMIENDISSINQPNISEPVKLMIYSTGLNLYSKLRTKLHNWSTTGKGSGKWTPLNQEAAFLKIFLQSQEPTEITFSELATRESILNQLR